MDSKTIKRNSNIELLRMICMYVIILHHSVLYGGGIEQPASVNLIFSNLFYIGGKFGANCFMAISAYFLLDSKFKVQRAISVWKTTFFYGILFFGLNLVFHFRGVGVRDILETILPVSYKAYWYVTAYVAIILLAPFLNYIIKVITKRQYKFLIVALLLMVTVPATFLPKAKPYYDESHVFLFVLIYFSIGFYKRGYLKNANKIACKLIAIGFAWMVSSSLAIIGVEVFTGKNSIVQYSTFWMSGESLPMIMAAVGVTIFVLELPAKSNKFINAFSKGTFDIYLIHMNHFIYEWLWTMVFPITVLTTKLLFPVYDVLIAMLIFVVMLVIGNIRCVTFKFVENRIRIQRLERIENRINNVFNQKGEE